MLDTRPWSRGREGFWDKSIEARDLDTRLLGQNHNFPQGLTHCGVKQGLPGGTSRGEGQYP